MSSLENKFMTTISILLIIVLVLVIDRKHNKRYDLLKDRYQKLKEWANTEAVRGNEHIRAFKELAGLLGYCVVETHEVKFDLASVLGMKKPEHIKKLLIHKTVVGKKVKVKSTK